ncbi:hypothetical protein GPECTOR_140g683 [Gonium pectorale]|uniref:Uncharacterized protein n=1 Tax=Gonium pectorale TaxID=33097 RepID=A0A150FY54_GONPE|nr:hypothetical protein GPECTOR_140g683 [Gonium pectorale]|eukprot:KXZ42507.1 hypothetical protein GPECTOR_140g683 [Gonium pectorale]
MHQARRQGKRVMRFRALDSLFNEGRLGKTETGRPAGGHLAYHASQLPVEALGDLLPDILYFEGAIYTLQENANPDAGHCRNSTVVATGILLDPREPPDTRSGEVWDLEYLPLAVFVRPESVRLDNLAPGVFPDGSIPIVPTTSAGVQLSFPEGVDLGDGRGTVTSVKLRRTNLPLSDGYVVTDYFAQGLSFGNEPWVVDLTPAPSNTCAPSIKQAAVYVMLSRFRSLATVRLLRPLFREGPASPQQVGLPSFDETVKAFHAATSLAPDLVAFLCHIELRAKASRLALADLRAELCTRHGLQAEPEDASEQRIAAYRQYLVDK